MNSHATGYNFTESFDWDKFSVYVRHKEWAQCLNANVRFVSEIWVYQQQHASKEMIDRNPELNADWNVRDDGDGDYQQHSSSAPSSSGSSWCCTVVVVVVVGATENYVRSPGDVVPMSDDVFQRDVSCAEVHWLASMYHEAASTALLNYLVHQLRSCPCSHTTLSVI